MSSVISNSSPLLCIALYQGVSRIPCIVYRVSCILYLVPRISCIVYLVSRLSYIPCNAHPVYHVYTYPVYHVSRVSSIVYLVSLYCAIISFLSICCSPHAGGTPHNHCSPPICHSSLYKSVQIQIQEVRWKHNNGRSSI